MARCSQGAITSSPPWWWGVPATQTGTPHFWLIDAGLTHPGASGDRLSCPSHWLALPFWSLSPWPSVWAELSLVFCGGNAPCPELSVPVAAAVFPATTWFSAQASADILLCSLADSLASPELGILPHWWLFDFLGKAHMPQPSSQESMALSSPSSAPALLWTIQLPGLKTCEPHSLQSFGATEHTRLHLCHQPVPRTPRQWAELCGKRRQSRQHSCPPHSPASAALSTEASPVALGCGGETPLPQTLNFQSYS